MKVLCLSKTLSNETLCYNKEKNICIETYKNNELKISMPLHSATHIDFPLHVNNIKSLNNYTISDFIFTKPYVREINLKDDYFELNALENIPKEIDLLIIKTNNHFGGINEKCAKYIKENFLNIKAIGVDCISLNAYLNKEEGKKAHRELLSTEKEILIIEDMDLNMVNEGFLNKVIVAPLMVQNADGTPVTVIAEVE